MCADSCQSIEVNIRRRPTPDEGKDFKSRVRYLVDVSGKGPGWWEAKSNGALARGQVQHWVGPSSRGKRPGGEMAMKAAEVFGVHWQWLWTGRPVRGAVFLDDPQESPVEQRLAQLERAVRDLAPTTNAREDDEEPDSRPRKSHPPAKLAKTTGRKRPG